MKKFLVALMALVMIFSLAACGGSPTDNSSQSVDDSSSSESVTTPAPESSEDSESTAADYMSWTLSDWSSASLTEQSSVLIEILAEVDTDASAQDIGATLGLYLGQGKTVGDFINDAKSDPSIIKGLDELTTAPSDYMDWTLADWSAASSEDQTATILTVISEIGVDASVQDIGASLGYYLGMGKTIGDFVNDAKADPSVVQSMDDIMADLEEDLSGLTE